MIKLVGKKLRMTQIFKDDAVVPVSLVKINKKSDLSQLKEGDLVKVSGLSKGKGFQGVVKRHGFAGGPQTHGQKNRQRAPGSIGNTTPQRVLPGRRMPGRMGGQRVTIKGLRIVEINSDSRTLLIKGALPGSEGGRVELLKIGQ